jgi:histidyl-tRNA synthetase
LLKSQGCLPADPVPDAYAVVPEAASMPQVMPVLRALRAMGVNVQMHAATAQGIGSMKSQFKKADASGARYALVFGTDELAVGQVTVKALRDGLGEQRSESLTQVAQWGHRLQSTL